MAAMVHKATIVILWNLLSNEAVQKKILIV